MGAETGGALGGSRQPELDWDGSHTSSDRERSVRGEAVKVQEGCNQREKASSVSGQASLTRYPRAPGAQPGPAVPPGPASMTENCSPISMCSQGPEGGPASAQLGPFAQTLHLCRSQRCPGRAVLLKCPAHTCWAPVLTLKRVAVDQPDTRTRGRTNIVQEKGHPARLGP